MRDLYQKLYEDQSLNYGSAPHDMSPGVRFLPFYQHYIKGDVVDLGGGRGHTALAIEKLGYKVVSVDWIAIAPEDMDFGTHAGIMYGQGDITERVNLVKPVRDIGDIEEPIFETGLCLDVFEHVDDEGLEGICFNLEQCERQVISVHVGESIIDARLHINRKSFEQWDQFIGERFEIVETVSIPNHHESRLYLTRSRDDSPFAL